MSDKHAITPTFRVRGRGNRVATVQDPVGLVIALLLSIAATSCDSRKGEKPPPPATLPGAGSGSSSGENRGPRDLCRSGAALPRLTVAGDDICVKLHPDGLPDESVVIGRQRAGQRGRLSCRRSEVRRHAREPALLDQVACQYVPHVVAVQVNQPLRVRSSDPCMHNVHVMGVNNTALNFAEIQPGEEVVRFAAPEFMKTRCDVHPWMKAVIAVFDTQYFAVTLADGKFALGNVPAGAYTLTVWHERFGEKTQKVTVTADGTVQANFTYAP